VKDGLPQWKGMSTSQTTAAFPVSEALEPNAGA